VSETVETLGDALQREIERVQEIRTEYLTLPNGVGMPAAAMMQASINAATRAMLEGDVIAMLRSYEDLKGHEQ